MAKLKTGVFDRVSKRSRAQEPLPKNKLKTKPRRQREKQHYLPIGDINRTPLPEGITWQPYKDAGRKGVFQISIVLKGTTGAVRVWRAIHVTEDMTPKQGEEEARRRRDEMMRDPDKFIKEQEENKRARNKNKAKILDAKPRDTRNIEHKKQ